MLLHQGEIFGNVFPEKTYELHFFNLFQKQIPKDGYVDIYIFRLLRDDNFFTNVKNISFKNDFLGLNVVGEIMIFKMQFLKMFLMFKI